MTFRDGVPIMNIEGVGEVEHPAWIGTYALAYMDAESFYGCNVEVNDEYAQNCVEWYKKNLTETGRSLYGWAYLFDSTYNDQTIHAPWYSSFGQAVGIDALVSWHQKTGDREALEIAKKAAEMLFTPLKEGGLLFREGDDIWFEEIPLTDSEPSHILNAQLRTCISLQKLYQATQEEKYLQWYETGIQSLLNWLPLYDAGYWLRYDLNPKKEGLLFRFNDVYGGTLPELAIDRIRLTDPMTGESIEIDAGEAGDMDATGGCYLAGLDWQAEETVDGRSVRRLAGVRAGDRLGSESKPNTYFYFDLPSQWRSNLRVDWYELTIVYKDEKRARMAVEQRSIAPGAEFLKMRDGSLLLTGNGHWREWRVPLRISDLGWPVGMLYAEKHLQYLEWLEKYSPEMAEWTVVARGYMNGVTCDLAPERNLRIVEAVKQPETFQTTPIDDFSLDADGVVLQHFSSDATTETTGYSPYIIAYQALYANVAGYSCEREPAYQWLNDHKIPIGDGYTWTYGFPNAYNDVEQKAGW